MQNHRRKPARQDDKFWYNVACIIAFVCLIVFLSAILYVYLNDRPRVPMNVRINYTPTLKN